MRDDLERQLDDLLGRVVQLGELTDLMLDAACRVLRDGDDDAGRAVTDAETTVDALDDEVQNGVVATIALHGPVGHDLRQLMALLRASLHLERMGDYAVSVARAAQRSAPFRGDEPLAGQLWEMCELAREVGRVATRSLVHQDAPLARTVSTLDDGVDQLNRGIFERLVSLAAQDGARLDWASEMILVARWIERYADHGVDLAEQALFVVTGERVELSSNARTHA